MEPGLYGKPIDTIGSYDDRRLPSIPNPLPFGGVMNIAVEVLGL